MALLFLSSACLWFLCIDELSTDICLLAFEKVIQIMASLPRPQVPTCPFPPRSQLSPTGRPSRAACCRCSLQVAVFYFLPFPWALLPCWELQTLLGSSLDVRVGRLTQIRSFPCSSSSVLRKRLIYAFPAALFCVEFECCQAAVLEKNSDRVHKYQNGGDNRIWVISIAKHHGKGCVTVPCCCGKQSHTSPQMKKPNRRGWGGA